ncbi:LysR substrate-binding domain-containing protein [Ruegeria sp. 2205SS24-7]|uniref:LysR substrate-binding domain-containing protein n=1 Tax=Ruegeria discodermiae TaxID=3064389 RepID=UPI002741ABBA|nr:LysR substrate-binding domain-containing protein [Ruegeria sp. 2205SS24-7]MDP5218495.1 LysR substrate-binding domain-containing protein [Ruegeria sp. 2205SS24-7]
MEVDWLEDYLALATVGVFSQAAQARNISQPAFTRRIKNLEHWVGTPLFDRSVHPVTLTMAGRAFRATASETIKMLRFAREDLLQHAANDQAVLRLSALHTLSVSFVPSWLKRLSNVNTPLQTAFTVGSYADCVEVLRTGSVDFMLSYEHPSMEVWANDGWFPSVRLAEDRLIAVSCPDTHGRPMFHFERPGKVPWLAYSSDSFLGRLNQSIVSKSGLSDSLTVTSENSFSEAQKAACIEGLGIAWLPEMSIKAQLSDGLLVPVGDSCIEHQMSVRLFRNMGKSRPAVEHFWALVKGACIDENLA